MNVCAIIESFYQHLDLRLRWGYHYNGFPLVNYEKDTNFYLFVYSVEECQYLCQITDLCQYFNYDIDKLICYLKFGIGQKSDHDNDYVFGHKYAYGEFYFSSNLNSNLFLNF